MTGLLQEWFSYIRVKMLYCNKIQKAFLKSFKKALDGFDLERRLATFTALYAYTLLGLWTFSLLKWHIGTLTFNMNVIKHTNELSFEMSYFIVA